MFHQVNSVFITGSSHGGHDVVDFEDVGLTNMKIFSGLSLQNGETYHATIKGDTTAQVSWYQFYKTRQIVGFNPPQTNLIMDQHGNN